MDVYYLVLLRHGESEGNARRIYQGHADFPLTERGREQAKQLALRWRQEGQTFDRVFASPLRRARETAEIVSKALAAPVEYDAIWMERDNGSRDGRDMTLEAPAYTPAPYYASYEGAESDWELFLRAGQALHRLLTLPPGRFLIVSHGGFLNAFMYAVLGLTPHGRTGPRFRFSNTGFAVVTYAPDYHTWYVHKMNDDTHLSDIGSDENDEEA